MQPPALPDGLVRVPSTLLRLDAAHVTDTDPALARTLLAPYGDGAAAGEVDALARGAFGGRYEPLGVLGEGGMGRVERVRDRDLLREIAVKHLRPELLGDAQLLAQFLWEARVTAYLDHPHIVPVHDLGVTPDGQLFYTMKLVRGATLETIIASARAGAEERGGLTRRLRVFLQLCHAVAYSHARGVLHRDLKPPNVMVGEFGEVIVTDWGIAIALPGPEGDELRPIMPEGLGSRSAGTPAYMSPEQARGEPLDETSDTYTLGAILYELVSLRAPYDATSVPQLLAKVGRGESVPLASIAPSLSPSLVAVVEKAMAPTKAGRYPNVRALAADVEAVLDGHTPAAEAASLVTRAARYYFARDPGMARLRVVDIDTWAGSAALFGAALVLFALRWFTPPSWLGAALLGASLLVGLVPTLRWLRLRREPRREEA